MTRTTARLRGPSSKERGPGRDGRLRSATAALWAAVALACAGAQPPDPAAAAAVGAQVRRHLDTGLALYGDGEYTVAAPHFDRAAQLAHDCGEYEAAADALAAACTSWLRARDLTRFSQCTERLAGAQKQLGRTDPGRNTLVALGAVAGRRPLPDLRLPDTVRPLVQDVAREFR